MLDVVVRSKRYNCDFQLAHKASVFLGDSGTGKTKLVEALTDASGGYSISTSKDCKFIKLTSNSWVELLEWSAGKENYVYIVDDDDFIFTEEFGKLYKNIDNSYFIFIVRATYIKDKCDVSDRISIPFDAIYEFTADGINHSIVPSSKNASIALYMLDKDFKAGAIC